MQPILWQKSDRALHIVGTVIAIAIAGLTFGSLSQHLFELDDLGYLTRAGAILSHPTALLASDGFGRPVVDIVFAITYALWGENPAAYHLLVVTCHLCATLVLVYVFQQSGADTELSWLAALFFLINVAHFRAIHWISCLAYPLGLIFGLITLICYSKWCDKKQTHLLFASICTLLLSIFTHPSLAAVSLFCLFIGYKKNGSLIQSWPLILCTVFGLTLISGIWSQAPQVNEASLIKLTASQWIHASLGFAGRLLTSAIFLPENLHITTTTDVLSGIAIILGVLILFVLRSHLTAQWGLWSLLFLLPFIPRLAHPFLTAGPSRYLYLSSVGTAFILAWIIRILTLQIQKLQYPSLHRMFYSATAVGVIALSFTFLKKAESITFYDSGRYYLQQGEHNTGHNLFQRAIERDVRIFPLVASYALAHGIVLQLTHQIQTPQHLLFAGITAFLSTDPNTRQKGEAQIQQAFDKAPSNMILHQMAAQAFHNLATYYQKNGQNTEAIALYRRALTHWPQYEKAYVNLSHACYSQGDLNGAIQALQKAIQLNPHLTFAYVNLGILHYIQGHYAQSVAAFEKAVAQAPEDEEALMGLAQAYEKNNAPEQAQQIYQRILNHNSHHTDARQGLHNLQKNNK